MKRIIGLMVLSSVALASDQLEVKTNGEETNESQEITTEQFVEKVLDLAQCTKQQSSKAIQKKLDTLKLPTQFHVHKDEHEKELIIKSPDVLRLIHALEKLHLRQFINLLDRFIPDNSGSDCFELFKKRLIVKLSPWMLNRFVQRINKKLEGDSPFPGIELDEKNEEQFKKNKALYETLKKKQVFKPFITYLQTLEEKGFVTQHDIKQLSDVQQAIQRRVDKIITRSLLEGKQEDDVSRQLSITKDLIMQWFKREAIKLQELAVC